MFSASRSTSRILNSPPTLQAFHSPIIFSESKPFPNFRLPFPVPFILLSVGQFGPYLLLQLLLLLLLLLLSLLFRNYGSVWLFDNALVDDVESRIIVIAAGKQHAGMEILNDVGLSVKKGRP